MAMTRKQCESFQRAFDRAGGDKLTRPRRASKKTPRTQGTSAMTTTEQKHTPGPWSTEERGNRQADGNRLWSVFAPDQSEYAIRGDLMVIAEDLSPGNAHLIAAAPDLLAVAQAVLSMLDASKPRPSVEDMERVEGMARAAVAKAQGAES